MSKGRLFTACQRLSEFIFFSNYFYGICAVALSIEATLQQRVPLNGPWFFFLIFITTVLYYAYPYIRKNLKSDNPRTNWYTRHYNIMRLNQLTITIILLGALVVFLNNYGHTLSNMSAFDWSLIFIFPLIAALYYGLNSLFGRYNLRKIGWLKPFVIGFTWAGLVTIYPVLFYDIINERNYELASVGGLLFVKNFMFISILCVMFDIKDYTADYLSRLKTFVVRIGLHKTIFYIVLPLATFGLISFIFYAMTHQFQSMKIFLNTIPFFLLAIVALSLHKHRSLLYYLAVVDGLMFVKAVCGTLAILYF